MSRRRGKVDKESFLHVFCPFCGHSCARDTPMNWCAGCYTFYEKTRTGRVWFDTSIRPTMAQAFAIAIAKTGGARIGPPSPFGSPAGSTATPETPTSARSAER